MLLQLLSLFLSLIFIVAASYIFCNALEHLGDKLGLSDGVVGSVLAAIATTIPETTIPLIAIFGAHHVSDTNAIGIGAILGAPLMLSTLSLAVMALFNLNRGIKGKVNLKPQHTMRDLRYFILGYGVATIATFIHVYSGRIFFAILLFLIYIFYLYRVFHELRFVESRELNEPLFLSKLGLKLNSFAIAIQLIVSLGLLFLFAHVFVDAIIYVAFKLKVSAFLVALIIAPIATELPEKVNSIIWLRKGKDSLALGNITGAMVYQGTILPILGILFTPWDLLNVEHLSSVIIAIIASVWLYLHVKYKELYLWVFIVNGLLYILSILIVLAI